MFHDLIEQITQFPQAEFVHLMQGAVAGWLIVFSYIHKRVEGVIIGFLILCAFAIYETLERWRIGDPADVDFQVALIFAWVSAVVTIAYYVIKVRRK